MSEDKLKNIDLNKPRDELNLIVSTSLIKKKLVSWWTQECTTAIKQ